jgi:hypothetical protein
MLMMASPVVTSRVRGEGDTRVAKLLQADNSNEAIIEELFLSSLSRRPTAEEAEVARQLLQVDRNRGAENIQWALLNSAEFLLNH